MHVERLKNFSENALPKISVKTGFSKEFPVILSLQNADNQGVIRFSTNGKDPTAQSEIYTKPINLSKENLNLRAAVFSKDGQQIGDVLSKFYEISKSTGKNYVLKNKEIYKGGGENGLTNGVKGEQKKLETWVGFEGVDIDAVVDLGEIQEIHRVSIQFLRNNSLGIFFPENVEILVSGDGKTFESIQKIELDASPNKDNSIQNLGIGIGNAKVRFVKVLVKNSGKNWLFVDEIVVE